MRGLLLLPETLTRKEVLHVWRIPFAPAPCCGCDDSLHQWKRASQDSRQSPNFSARPNSTAVSNEGILTTEVAPLGCLWAVKKPRQPMWTLNGTRMALFPLVKHFSGFYREKRAGLSPPSLSLHLSLSVVNSSSYPGVTPQSLNSRSQLLCLLGYLCPCPEYL